MLPYPTWKVDLAKLMCGVLFKGILTQLVKMLVQ
jgi:hypothetical protein